MSTSGSPAAASWSGMPDQKTGGSSARTRCGCLAATACMNAEFAERELVLRERLVEARDQDHQRQQDQNAGRGDRGDASSIEPDHHHRSDPENDLEDERPEPRKRLLGLLYDGRCLIGWGPRPEPAHQRLEERRCSQHQRRQGEVSHCEDRHRRRGGPPVPMPPLESADPDGREEHQHHVQEHVGLHGGVEAVPDRDRSPDVEPQPTDDGQQEHDEAGSDHGPSPADAPAPSLRARARADRRRPRPPTVTSPRPDTRSGSGSAQASARERRHWRTPFQACRTASPSVGTGRRGRALPRGGTSTRAGRSE